MSVLDLQAPVLNISEYSFDSMGRVTSGADYPILRVWPVVDSRDAQSEFAAT